MKVSRLTRISVAVAAALAVPLGGAVVLSAVTAGAAGATISCTKASGSDTSTVKLKGCTPTSTTGGKSKALNVSTLASGGVVKWKSGKTTTLSAPTLGTGTNCPAGTSVDETFSGTVTADTTGSAPVGGPYSGEACISSSGAITLPHGHPFTAD
jgi:hypothetical protein